MIAGTLAAATLAWVAIAAFAALGRLELRTGPIRGFGAAALAVLALGVAGIPVPWAIAPGLLGIGLVLGVGAPLVESA